MFKNTLIRVSVVFGVAFLIGCASSDVETRRYVEIRDRVDQNMEGGNAGFLSGTPQPEDRSEFKKTRKIYVLEVSQGDPVDDTVIAESVPEETYGFVEEPASYQTDNLIEVSRDAVFSPMRDDSPDIEEAEMPTTPSTVEYTVQKDDTLQKISKKFYDSFSKWPKIYEANKSVIDNPDRIKPGIVIQIPME